MQEHKITKEDGTDIKWTIAKNKNSFCLLYNDSKQKFKFTPTENLNCEVFMIGGGGAGGYFFGGGGGAGASYINNNYTFKKNKTYTFEIGTGGMCDIADINKLFKSGLTLNIYNNTNIKLLNLNFTNDDYSSLGIQNSGMMQSFNVNNITIPASIFHNNTTYIWEGYIKTNSTGYFNVTINTKINTIIWVDKFVFNNDNALIEGNNINDVKIIQLETNKFYNIKIIAHNDTNNSNNFNVSFEGCQLFNFDKNEEKYNYIPATDTILTYRNDDNTFETLRCKGGGNGGCGFFNKNTTLDGGCGGGSGINKIKGTSIITPIYNGYDGAIGDYCGGGGGIMSAGKNNLGGDGKIINWFNETLIFGAGGNAANLSETRNLGYGCGGNGGECCYYSKLLINNNGNNGCILIYVKSSPLSTVSPIIEGFTDKATNMLPDDSISKKLIENSFKISKYSFAAPALPTRSLFLSQTDIDMHYLKLADIIDVAKNKNTGTITYTDTYKNEYFIFDMLIISKLYAIIYRLYWYHYNKTLNGDTIKWKDFCEKAIITLTTDNTNTTSIKDYTVNINNLVSLTSLRLTTTVRSNDKTYNDKLYTVTGTSASPYADGDVNISSTIINEYCKQIDIINNNVPIYHKVSSTGDAIPLLSDIATELTTNARYTIIFGLAANPIANGITAETDNDINKINMCAIANTITRDDVDKYNTASSAHNRFTTDIDNYLVMRKHIYLEALNTIFNTNPDIILATLKYNMYYYNLVVYNVAIQYGLVKIQNERITIGIENTSTPLCYKGSAGNVETTTDIKYGKIPISVAAQSAATMTSGATLKIVFNSAANTILSVNIADSIGTTLSASWYSGTFLIDPTFSKRPTFLSGEPSSTATIILPTDKSKIFIGDTTYSLTNTDFTVDASTTNDVRGKTLLYDIIVTPQLAIAAESGSSGSGPYAIVNNDGIITELGGFSDILTNRNSYVVPPVITLLASTQANGVLANNVILIAENASLYNNSKSKKNINLYNLTYNGAIFNNNGNPKLIPVYGIVCPDDFTSRATINYKTLSAAAAATTDINTDLSYLINNVTKLSDELNESKQYANTIKNLSDTSSTNISTSNDFYNNQQDLNKTINEYNGELENFNNISFYYKLVVAFAIVLTIIILFIFGTKSIDNNSKISVYVIIIVLIIIAFIIYKQYSGVKEGFTIIYKDSTSTALGNAVTFPVIATINSINTYKLAVEKLINKVILSLTNSNVGESLNSSLTYIKKLSVIKNEKAEIYKIKKISLMNSIEILKKNANFYYYIIIAIFVSIIILNIGLILYLLNPAMIMQIVILCAIPFIILIYIVSYYIHKSTRLAENKNYWSNFNPSSSTLEILNVS